MVMPNVTLEEVEEALRRVPLQRLSDVLTFIEFLEYRAEQEDDATGMDDASEDDALWAAVQANQAYKAKHPKDVIIHETGEDFLADTADL
ncbi:hypothetical protein TFLX_02089 [Thermoflexales bacterium]|nr:hypothetical protein TFLX_02089 [Thermoflexales bacterium]